MAKEPKPKIRFIIGTGPNLIKASIDKDLGPDIGKSILVGVQENSAVDLRPGHQPQDRVRLTQLRLHSRTGPFRRGGLFWYKDRRFSISIRMYFHGTLAHTENNSWGLTQPQASWVKNWLPGVDWSYNGILEFKDTVLVIELDSDPGPFILSILGKGIDRHIPYPRQELKLKEEDHSE